MRKLGTWKSSLMRGHLESCCPQEPRQLTNLCTSCRSKTALLKQISCLGSEKQSLICFIMEKEEELDESLTRTNTFSESTHTLF